MHIILCRQKFVTEYFLCHILLDDMFMTVLCSLQYGYPLSNAGLHSRLELERFETRLQDCIRMGITILKRATCIKGLFGSMRL